MCRSLIMKSLKAPFKFAAKAQNRFDPVTRALQSAGYAGNGLDPAHFLNAKLGGIETATQERARTQFNPTRRLPEVDDGGSAGLAIAGRRGPSGSQG